VSEPITAFMTRCDAPRRYVALTREV